MTKEHQNTKKHGKTPLRTHSSNHIISTKKTPINTQKTPINTHTKNTNNTQKSPINTQRKHQNHYTQKENKRNHPGPPTCRRCGSGAELATGTGKVGWNGFTVLVFSGFKWPLVFYAFKWPKWLFVLVFTHGFLLAFIVMSWFL